MDIANVKKEIQDLLADPTILDKDVFIYEKVQEFKKSSHNMDVYEVLITHPACSKDIWEEIADECFHVLSSNMTSERNKVIALLILGKYREYMKRVQIDFSVHQIPDNVLEFEVTGRKYTKVSKLRYPLHEIDLKVLNIYDQQSLDEMEEDTILLLAMIRKRREQLTQPKKEYKFSQRVYRDKNSKKQMIHLRVGKYRPVFDNNGLFLYTDDEAVLSIHLPFKKSDPELMKAINKKVKGINQTFKLKVALF